MEIRHTLVHQLAHWAEERPQVPAIHEKDASGAWRTYTWAEYWQAVRDTAKGLIALGHQVGDCVALIGGSRCGWVISEFGIMAARGIPAPIYPNNTADQAAYIVKHSRSKIAIADTGEQLAKYREGIERGLMSAEKLIVMDEPTEDEMSFEALLALGREQDDAELDKRLAELTPDETQLLIYTSGTTGTPKGVQLSHTNMIALTKDLLTCFPMFNDGVKRHRVVSYLPLCHIAEQIATNFAQFAVGGEVFFCGDMTKIKDYLTEVRPTVFLGVPRVWEKFQGVLESRFAEATGIKAMLANWARNTEFRSFQRELESGKPHMPLGRKVAQRLVISKVKDALGLDKLELAVTGAAPISEGTLEFFASLGIIIYNVYGQSETTGIMTSPRYGQPRFASVGRAFDCVEVKIAEDGEILVKGPICTKGYLHQPEETAALFDEEGWLLTGDLGQMDAEGYLRITGRKKEIIVTAGGKNIAPAEMEAHINQISGVAQVVVVGDKKPYLTALITLDPEALDVLCADAGAQVGSLAEVAQDEQIHAYLMDKVETGCNAKVARYQTIKKIKVLPSEFSVDGGELTPTMKCKRNVVLDKYGEDIEALYG
ncbi:MAG: long-chain fatty acid--CoA ligase [Deltaproteobacteria bacterium]|nr:long-chain fatty acid--CoA ligase [Deltaproteobacteria bacterium]